MYRLGNSGKYFSINIANRKNLWKYHLEALFIQMIRDYRFRELIRKIFRINCGLNSPSRDKFLIKILIKEACIFIQKSSETALCFIV